MSTKYQVLVIPYHIENGNVKYCIFKRNDMKVWQFIAGGGEDEDETIIISAKREAYEEANIGMDCKYSVLDTQIAYQHTVLKKQEKYGVKIVWLFLNIHLLLEWIQQF